MSSDKVSIIIPAYNEAQSIGDIIHKIMTLHPDFEVIVINDGSTDYTGTVAKDAGAIVFSHPFNLGNGAAIKSGIRIASGDILVFMDGDGQHDPEDIEKMLIFFPEYDMVVGARPKGEQTSWFRGFGNRVFNWLSSYVAKFSIEEASRFSLNFETLKHLILPLRFNYDFATNPASLKSFFPGSGEMPWLLTIYPGFIILPLALFGLFFNYSRRTLLWFGTFCITLILALGDNTPFYQFFYKIFPFFRFPEKFIFLTSFSLLVMAAFGADRMISLLNQRVRRVSLFFILIITLVFIDLYLSHRNLNPLCQSTLYQYHHPYFKPILDDPETFRTYLDPESKTPVEFENTILNHHIKWQMLLMPNLGILHNLSHVNGTTGLELRYQYLITEILMNSWSEKIHFLKLANVKYIISSQRLDKKLDLKGQVTRINPLVYKINGYLPRAWMVGQLLPIKTGLVDEIINGSFDPMASALAKGDIVNRYNKPFFKKIDNISYESNSRIHMELTTEEPGILILSESSYPGWQVFINGKEKECLWLNLLFQGVEIDKGTHEIDFVFRPKRFKLFLSISLISLVLFFAVWSYYGVMAKKERHSKSPLI